MYCLKLDEMMVMIQLNCDLIKYTFTLALKIVWFGPVIIQPSFVLLSRLSISPFQELYNTCQHSSPYFNCQSKYNSPAQVGAVSK